MKIELLNVNTDQLHDELIQEGIKPVIVQSIDNKTILTLDDNVDIDNLNIVIANHIPKIKNEQATEAERLEALEMLMVDILGGGF